jgi:hypothetical protein
MKPPDLKRDHPALIPDFRAGSATLQKVVIYVIK